MNDAINIDRFDSAPGKWRGAVLPWLRRPRSFLKTCAVWLFLIWERVGIAPYRSRPDKPRHTSKTSEVLGVSSLTWRTEMTSKAKYLLLGSTLLALSGYSLGNTSEEQSTQASNSHAIVTGIYSTDREIHAEVLRRIGEKPALATENIDVQSFDHNVYLYGSVTSRKDSEQAEAIARTVPGVRKVYNSLGLFGG
jgi:hypothetical protein